MNERWLSLWLDGRYEVSDQGRLRRVVTGRILKPWVNRYGYAYVEIGGKGLRVNRLIAEAFHGPPPFSEAEAHHKNGSKLDNRASNLEWVSRSENVTHGYRSGLIITQRRRSNMPNKLTISDVRCIRTSVETRTALAERYGVTPTTIRKVQTRIAYRDIAD